MSPESGSKMEPPLRYDDHDLPAWHTNMRTLDTDICILGAGPAGLVLANLLRWRGIGCVVVDKHTRTEIYERGRAGIIEHRIAAELDRHGLGEGMDTRGRTHTRCEFRNPERSVIFEYGDLCGPDVAHVVYPQNALVEDLMDYHLDAGGIIMFATEAVAIANREPPQVTCRERDSGAELTIRCRYIAGCDGFHGLARQSAVSASGSPVRVYEKQHTQAWLAILAEARPSTRHIIYAMHPRGFAGHMLRTEHISRYYLQVSWDEDLDAWPDERVWSELHARLAHPGWTLSEGRITQKGLLAMRSYVVEPMRWGRVLLAGDAAHIITPCGGKGMNLAIADALVLAEMLASCLDRGDESYLDEYSRIRLPRVWEAEEFSYAMLQMLHRSDGDPAEVPFMQRVKASLLEQLERQTLFAHDFARKYVGYDG